MNSHITQSLKKLSVGQALAIETANELLIGTVKYINLERKIIELDNVHDERINYTYTSPQILVLPQIKTIKIINNDDDKDAYSDDDDNNVNNENIPFNARNGAKSHSYNATDSTTSTSTYQSSLESAVKPAIIGNNKSATTTNATNEHDITTMNITPQEFQQIQEQLNNVIYIAQTDHQYHKAIADMKRQEVFALLVEPKDFGRNHKKTTLIVAATHNNVYIFDMLALGNIFREFKVVLEAKRPRKIVHYSHKICDHLVAQHSVQLSGIFDTFVAYSLVTGVKKPSNLLQTIEKVFNIPHVYFDYNAEADNVHHYDIYHRPLTQQQRQYIAKIAIFQLRLYEYLLHEQMLGNFYKQCNEFSKTFSDNEDIVEVATQMQPQSQAGYEYINNDGSWEEILNAKLL